jgi:hypothetical protein
VNAEVECSAERQTIVIRCSYRSVYTRRFGVGSGEIQRRGSVGWSLVADDHALAHGCDELPLICDGAPVLPSIVAQTHSKEVVANTVGVHPFSNRWSCV